MQGILELATDILEYRSWYLTKPKTGNHSLEKSYLSVSMHFKVFTKPLKKLLDQFIFGECKHNLHPSQIKSYFSFINPK